MKPSLIVGVDPGTTTAVAAISISGEPVFFWSKRNSTLAETVDAILEHGYPVLLATDKAKLPAYVGKLAALFKTKAFTPEKDLPVDEKKTKVDAARGDSRINIHESDAFAAALFAFTDAAPLLRKARAALHKAKAGAEIEHLLLRRLFREEARNIRDGIEALTGEPPAAMRKKAGNGYSDDAKAAIARLEAGLKRHRLLEQAYLERIRELEEQGKESTRKRGSGDAHLLAMRSQTIHDLMRKTEMLENKVRQLEKAHTDEEEAYQGLLSRIAGTEDAVLVERIPDLTAGSLARLKKTARIASVERPELFTKEAIAKTGLRTIMAKPPKNRLLNERFLFISPEEITSVRGFSLYTRKAIGTAMAEADLLGKIVREHKESKGGKS